MSLDEGSFNGPEVALGWQFPEQLVLTLPAGYTLTPADEAEVLEGRAFFFAGDVIARIVHACQFFPNREVFMYLTVSPANPFLISSLHLPVQDVSSCHCRVQGSAVLQAGRAVRALGRRIVGGAHSHGTMHAFSSGTDLTQMIQLARETAGWPKMIEEKVQGEISSEEVPEDSALSCHLKARFPNVEESLEIKSSTVQLTPGDVQITAQHTTRQVVSTFVTANSRGQFFAPAIKRCSCWACGWSHQVFIEARDVRVFVLGPVAIRERDRRELDDELMTRVQPSAWARDVKSATEADHGFRRSTTDEDSQ